jgi:hypothetical protein
LTQRFVQLILIYDGFTVLSETAVSHPGHIESQTGKLDPNGLNLKLSNETREKRELLVGDVSSLVGLRPTHQPFFPEYHKKSKDSERLNPNAKRQQKRLHN